MSVVGVGDSLRLREAWRGVDSSKGKKSSRSWSSSDDSGVSRICNILGCLFRILTGPRMDASPAGVPSMVIREGFDNTTFDGEVPLRIGAFQLDSVGFATEGRLVGLRQLFGGKAAVCPLPCCGMTLDARLGDNRRPVCSGDMCAATLSPSATAPEPKTSCRGMPLRLRGFLALTTS